MNNPSVTFLHYNMDQLHLPMDVGEWIPANHIVRLIHQVVEQMDLEELLSQYPGGGRSSYHPRMMLKIILYAYTQQITSGRRIAKMCQENLPMIWLSGRSEPDFRTINRFRSEKMKDTIGTVFQALITQLVEQELTDPSTYYLDGTKIEANANKYSFVWIKATQNYQTKLSEKIHAFLEEAVLLAEEENEAEPLLDSMTDLSAMAEKILTSMEESPKNKKEPSLLTAEHLQSITDQIERVETEYQQKELPRRRQQKVRKLKKLFQDDFLPRMRKYEAHHRIAQGRNSFSKKDPDATFMRMKEDHMRNGQLKAGYNVQMGTNNQYILFYTLHPNPTDTRTLKDHLLAHAKTALPAPKHLIADAGYASEENYLFLDDEKIHALIPYNTFRKEPTKRYQTNLRYWQNWEYHPLEDYFVCPQGRFVEFSHYAKKKDAYGYTRDLKIYECEDCRVSHQRTMYPSERELEDPLQSGV